MVSMNQEQAISYDTIVKCVELINDDKWGDAIKLFDDEENCEHLYYKALLSVMHFEKHRKEIPCFSLLQALDAINKALCMKAEPKYYYLKSIACYNLSLFPGTLPSDRGNLAKHLLESLVNSKDLLTFTCNNSIRHYVHFHPKESSITASMDDSIVHDSDATFDTKSASGTCNKDWLEQALDAIEMALQHDDSTVDYGLLKAKIFVSRGQLETARALLESTKTKNPDRNDVILDLIDVQEKMDMGREVINTINEVLRNSPSNMTLVEKKIKLLIKHEMNDELDEYRKILTHNTDLTFGVYLALITASITLHDIASAVAVINKAISVDFVPERYFLDLVWECMSTNEYMEAIKVIHLAKHNYYQYDYDQDSVYNSLEELYYIVYDNLIREKEYEEALRVAEMATSEGIGRIDAERIRPLTYLGRLSDAVSIIQEQNSISDEGAIEEIIMELWESAYCYEVHRLCEELRDSDSYWFIWYNLWACVELNLHNEVEDCLAKLSFRGMFKQLLSPTEGRNKENRSKELFQQEFPFHKLQTESFLTLLSLLFEGYMKLSEIKNEYSSLKNSVLNRTSNYDPSLINDAVYIDLQSRIEILHKYLDKSVEFPKDFLHFVLELLYKAISSMQSYINAMIVEIRVQERNRILSNLSHSIKNMLKAVIDPLMNLRDEIPQKAIIRLSFKSSGSEF